MFQIVFDIVFLRRVGGLTYLTFILFYTDILIDIMNTSEFYIRFVQLIRTNCFGHKFKISMRTVQT